MEHMLSRSICSIFHNILKNLTFQRRPKVLVWSKGLSSPEHTVFKRELLLSVFLLCPYFSFINCTNGLDLLNKMIIKAVFSEEKYVPQP